MYPMCGEYKVMPPMAAVLAYSPAYLLSGALYHNTCMHTGIMCSFLPKCAGLSELASSAIVWADAASAVAGPQAANLAALATLAHERLSALEPLDAASFATLQTSIGALMGGLRELLDHEAGAQAGQATSALVLGVQQLVAISRLDEAGGAYSVDAMAEAQAAFQNAAKVGAGIPYWTCLDWAREESYIFTPWFQLSSFPRHPLSLYSRPPIRAPLGAPRASSPSPWASSPWC